MRIRGRKYLLRRLYLSLPSTTIFPAKFSAPEGENSARYTSLASLSLVHHFCRSCALSARHFSTSFSPLHLSTSPLFATAKTRPVTLFQIVKAPLRRRVDGNIRICYKRNACTHDECFFSRHVGLPRACRCKNKNTVSSMINSCARGERRY